MESYKYICTSRKNYILVCVIIDTVLVVDTTDDDVIPCREIFVVIANSDIEDIVERRILDLFSWTLSWRSVCSVLTRMWTTIVETYGSGSRIFVGVLTSSARCRWSHAGQFRDDRNLRRSVAHWIGDKYTWIYFTSKDDEDDGELFDCVCVDWISFA